MKKFIPIITLVIVAAVSLLVYHSESLSELAAERLGTGHVSEFKQEDFVQPLDRINERIVEKPFGIFVSPGNSPISPERFAGYHNAIDYEVFNDEQSKDVSVMAVCGGELIQKSYLSGYGGLAIQKCFLDNESILIYYGHLRLSSIKKEINSYLSPGEQFAVLGQGFSQETDGERKHLHLGVSKGDEIDVKGYVQNKSELEKWIDFNQLINQ